MSKGLPSYPFDPHRCIGTVCEVTPQAVRVNLPDASTPDGQWLFGNRSGCGEVGEFIVVECGEFGVFGRIISVKLPERDRLSVEPGLGKSSVAHPVGTIQLLATICLGDGKVTGGVSQFPRLGCRIYTAHPNLVKWLAEAKKSGEGASPVLIDLASLPMAGNTRVSFTPETLFGRHCAVLGATGGGKSWTIARLVEQAARYHAKIILLDATGEFSSQSGESIKHVYLGPDSDPSADTKEVVIPYSNLTEGDLCALFNPSGQTQGPKLRAAIKTLKLLKVVPGIGTSGIYIKAQKRKQQFEDNYRQQISIIESSAADFDITKLSRQVDEECVYPSGGTGQVPDYTMWGRANEMERGYCFTLMSRIDDMTKSKDLGCIFQPGDKPSLFTVIEDFLTSPCKSVLRVSLKYLGFAYHAREIVSNAIGRHLLTLARGNRFKERPLFVFLDEAHQFLSKSLGDENNKYHLDAFDLIAKEGRKYALNICIATQRPRDIPEGVLSQMGTLIVHRLTNESDRDVVERASGDIDRSAAAFLPTLAPGQAIIIGVDFPIPLTVQISQPANQPDSRGPDFQKWWSIPVTAPAPATVNAAVISTQPDTTELDEDVPFRKDRIINL